MIVKSIWTFGICLLWLMFLGVSASEAPLPEVKILQGRLIGKYMKTDKGKEFEAFLGIPFAKPPVGELRFKEPQPPVKWTGFFNASQYGQDCLQYSIFAHINPLNQPITGSENCLFVNVYRPKVSETGDFGPLDVIVFIHGGGFVVGAGRWTEPTYLIDKNIIFVSLNYRLGTMGFMSTGDKVMPGNLGLKDQSAALRWVQNNIKYFGGNPENVMITGSSAGGASVHFHYFSPLSQGLFSKGIAGSGVSLNPWSIAESVPQKTKRLASMLGCPTDNSDELVDCLNARPADQIVSQIVNFHGYPYLPFAPFGPIVEPEGTEEPFLPIHPADALNDGQFTKVPLLITYASEEGLVYVLSFMSKDGVNTDLLNNLEDNWTKDAPHYLDYNFTVRNEDRKKVAELIKRHYFKDKSFAVGIRELIQMAGDRTFNTGIEQTVLMQASKAPVYVYRFGYKRKVPLSNIIFTKEMVDFIAEYGVSHGDDSFYILKTKVMISNGTTNEDDEEIQRRLINVWITFLKTGVPEFHEGVPLPNAKEGLPRFKIFDIRSPSPSGAAIKTEDQLGQLRFWSTVPLDEKLNLPNSNLKFQEEL